MGKFKIDFFVMDVILLIVFLGLIKIIFNLHRIFLILELLFLAVIALFALIAMIAIYNGARWGWAFLSYIFGLILIDILSIYYIKGKPEFFLTTAIVAVIGFLISIANIKKRKKFKGVGEVPEKVEGKVSKEFKPGKYVASETGNRYHIPKCDWAKKIKKTNQVWFDTEEEAKNKGYKPDNCVKQSVYKNF